MPEMIPTEEWCKLCEALVVMPDSPMDTIILKAQKMNELAHSQLSYYAPDLLAALEAIVEPIKEWYDSDDDRKLDYMVVTIGYLENAEAAIAKAKGRQ